MRISEPSAGDVILRSYRNRVVSTLGLISSVAFLPFAINNFVQRRILLGSVAMVFLTILTVSAVATRRGKDLPLSLFFIFIPMALSLPLLILSVGIIGVLWCYPAVLFFFFVLPRRAANIVAAVILVLVSPVIIRNAGGLPATVRFAITLVLVIVFSNIVLSIIYELHAKLSEQAMHDPLTGAYNRRYLDHVIREVIASSEKNLALLVLDIDYFKRVNDQHGHAIGDQVICDVAATVQKADPAFALFRIGGEEFAVLARNTSEETAVACANYLREQVASKPQGTIEKVTVSIGVAVMQSGETQSSWLKRADAALYRAKLNGRNCVCSARALQTDTPGAA